MSDYSKFMEFLKKNLPKGVSYDQEPYYYDKNCRDILITKEALPTPPSSLFGEGDLSIHFIFDEDGNWVDLE